MAKELEVAAMDIGMRVLEIGAGTGYNAALISHLVGDPKLVTTVELDDTLAQLAQQHLDRVIGLGVQVITGDGYQGYVPNAPYDRILATASTQQVPLAWIDQLRDGGMIDLHLQGSWSDRQGRHTYLSTKSDYVKSGSGMLLMQLASGFSVG